MFRRMTTPFRKVISLVNRGSRRGNNNVNVGALLSPSSSTSSGSPHPAVLHGRGGRPTVRPTNVRTFCGVTHPEIFAALACIVFVLIGCVALLWHHGSGVGSGVGSASYGARKNVGAVAWAPNPSLSPTLLFPYIVLRNGVHMPALGLGTAGLGERSQTVIENALRLGYRLVDTASRYAVWYQNEHIVGGLVQGQAHSGHMWRREDVFITTKIHPQDLGTKSTDAAIDTSLGHLKSDTIDLMLLHYGRCVEHVTFCVHEPQGDWKDAWRVLEARYRMPSSSIHAADRRRVLRSIGVSNFGVVQLQQLLDMAKVRPHVVQTWIDPLRQSRTIVDFCRKHKIAVQSYSTLGTQWMAKRPGHDNPVLTHRVITMIAKKHNRSAACVVLRWALQSDIGVIPKSADAEHLKSNLYDTLSFVLDDADMGLIDGLDGEEVA
eukprot:PhM_4_TR4747/c0_g1_i1/m.8499